MAPAKKKGSATNTTRNKIKPVPIQNATISSTPPVPKPAAQRPALGDTTTAVNNTDSIELKAQLQKLQEENLQLKQENQNGRDKANQKTARIPRPPGAVSTWKLQQEMQLTGSVEMSDMYAGIQRVVVEAVRASPINWSSCWNKIPPNQKADLYATVRSKVEGLERYEQDWATEGLARQYLKNKRSYNYRKGLLDVPEVYHYLKDNASQRSDAPRGNTHKRKAAQAKKQGAAAKKARLSKGKEKAINDDSNSDEEEEDEEEG